MFIELMKEISKIKELDFDKITNKLEKIISKTKIDNFLDIIHNIGIIPESIGYDTKEEKIFSKLSDIVLSRAFRYIGFDSCVLKERGNSADVYAESKKHKYSLVIDAKSFRMSRTAKNQKDFKISALSKWRGNEDYSVLCSPYFQYPMNRSQIYSQSLEHNVCLLSWEHLIFLIENKIKENENINLKNIWNFGYLYSDRISFKGGKNNFFDDFNIEFLKTINIDNSDIFYESLNKQIDFIIKRGGEEKSYLEKEINLIKNYTKDRAIDELIKSKKIEDRIKHIDDFIEKVKL